MKIKITSGIHNCHNCNDTGVETEESFIVERITGDKVNLICTECNAWDKKSKKMSLLLAKNRYNENRNNSYNPEKLSKMSRYW